MIHISFRLDTFEGPLDLLLHLIAKHKLNIYDISISSLLEQYMDYMNEVSAQDLDIAGEFLEMLARLIYIKTVSLLPKSNDEAEEMKKELQGALIEYSICKLTAEELKKLFSGNDIFVRRPEKIEVDKRYKRRHDVSELLNAYNCIDIKKPEIAIVKNNIDEIVNQKHVSVTTKVIFILRSLYKTGSMYMEGLYKGVTDRSERVATFLAVLELTKSGRIYINEDNTEIKFIAEQKHSKHRA